MVSYDYDMIMLSLYFWQCVVFMNIFYKDWFLFKTENLLEIWGV